MFYRLRILFTIISVVFVAAVLPVGAWLGLIPAIICAAAAAVCYVLMLLFKQEQAKREPQPNETPVTPDNHKDNAKLEENAEEEK